MTKPKQKPVEKLTREELFQSVPHVFRDEAAAAGDVMGLFRTIVASPSGGMTERKELNRLECVLRRAAAKDPQALVRDVLAEGIVTTCSLLLRTELQLQAILRRQGSPSPGGGPTPLPAEVGERLLPRLQGLHEHLMTLSTFVGQMAPPNPDAAGSAKTDATDGAAEDPVPSRPPKKPLPPDLELPEDPREMNAFWDRAIAKYTIDELTEYGMLQTGGPNDVEERMLDMTDRAVVVARQRVKE